MLPSGIVELDYNYRPQDMVKMAGITFDFPEKEITGATLLANGPYRVYNNRMKGGSLNIWEKKYNNTITGESWDYPEFKGYYSLFYGMKLDCPLHSKFTAEKKMSACISLPQPYKTIRSETQPHDCGLSKRKPLFHECNSGCRNQIRKSGRFRSSISTASCQRKRTGK